jgi:cell fate regulator YaaT (PSP1 superfamily)
MIKIAGVRFQESWKVYDFDATDVEIAVGDKVIVDSDRGVGFAQVVRLRRMQAPVEAAPVEQEIELSIDGIEESVPESPPASSVFKHAPQKRRSVLRKATEEDLARQLKNQVKEGEAFTVAQEMIAERELPMKLIRVEYSFDATRATFYFFSESRVDFRDLVKDLAFKLKSRIEMRQIGVRDVARMIGGFGPCGRELCCSAFLKNFEPVSIRMAKKQDMVLNPAKISGVCGRLLCCLSYEYEMYDEIKKDLVVMRQAVIQEKRNEEEIRITAERKEQEERRLAEEKRRQEERPQQDQRRDKQKEGGQKGGRSEKKKDQQGKKGKQRSDKPSRERPQQTKPEKQQKPEARQTEEPNLSVKPPDEVDQTVQQPQQEGDKSGKKKRRRFWRRKKKGSQQGESKPPQGPGTP